MQFDVKFGEEFLATVFALMFFLFGVPFHVIAVARSGLQLFVAHGALK